MVSRQPLHAEFFSDTDGLFVAPVAPVEKFREVLVDVAAFNHLTGILVDVPLPHALHERRNIQPKADIACGHAVRHVRKLRRGRHEVLDVLRPFLIGHRIHDLSPGLVPVFGRIGDHVGVAVRLRNLAEVTAFNHQRLDAPIALGHPGRACGGKAAEVKESAGTFVAVACVDLVVLERHLPGEAVKVIALRTKRHPFAAPQGASLIFIQPCLEFRADNGLALRIYREFNALVLKMPETQARAVFALPFHVNPACDTNGGVHNETGRSFARLRIQDIAAGAEVVRLIIVIGNHAAAPDHLQALPSLPQIVTRSQYRSAILAFPIAQDGACDGGWYGERRGRLLLVVVFTKDVWTRKPFITLLLKALIEEVLVLVAAGLPVTQVDGFSGVIGRIVDAGGRAHTAGVLIQHNPATHHLHRRRG